MAAEYDKIVGDVDSRFRGLTGPEERKAAMRQEVWEPTRSALQVGCHHAPYIMRLALCVWHQQLCSVAAL